MSQFNGFPTGMRFTSIPNPFFSSVMPDITDIDELKITLHIFRLMYTKKGSIRFVTETELLSDAGVIECLSGHHDEVPQALEAVLDKATARGTILRMDTDVNNTTEKLFFINTENDRNLITKIREGSLVLKGLKAKTVPAVSNQQPAHDIYTMYEENIGMLTPIIADWLKEAEQQYPEAWIKDAMKEAVSLNKRNWRYIDRILANWSAEGRGDGTHRRNNQTDPGKYRKQKYDHLIKR
jgi:DnaD/phage-associated family protein